MLTILQHSAAGPVFSFLTFGPSTFGEDYDYVLDSRGDGLSATVRLEMASARN